MAITTFAAALILAFCLFQPLTAQECSCSRFRLLSTTVKPVQTDNSFLALVGSSISVTCEATVALLDSQLCEYRGCVKVNWLQNNTKQIFGSDTAESFSEALLSVSGVLQLDPITWNNAGIYKCLIDFEQSNSQGETFQISLSELRFSGSYRELTLGGSSTMLSCAAVPQIAASTLRMLDERGTVVTSSTGGSVSVTLPAVSQALNGTVYTCAITSQHLMLGEGNATAVVTVRDTFLSVVQIENQEREVVEAVPSKQFNCTITLNSPIGPDHSALVVSWEHNNQSVSSSDGSMQTSPSGAVVNKFTSVLRLTNIDKSDEGQYCCSASLTGTTSTLSHCIDITVTGLTVSENHHNLRVGSEAVINCTAPSVLSERTLTWSNPNGVVVVMSTSQTADLILTPVDYAKRGTYMCTLSSPQLVNNRIESIEVTVEATHISDLVSLTPNVLAVKGSPSVVLKCVASVSSEIGPSYSPLTIRWSLNGSPIVSVAPQPLTSNPLQTGFMSTIEFTNVDTPNTGQYCCTARINGMSSSRTACSALSVTEIMIAGSHQNIIVGSTATITCSLGSVANSTSIRWLSQDGTVVNNTNTLTLQTVDNSVNGTVFKCGVDAPSLYSPAEKSITVSVRDTNVTSTVFTNSHYYTLRETDYFELQCNITLSNTIGPSHNALRVLWQHNLTNVSNQASNPSSEFALSTTFLSTLRLTNLGTFHEGEYCCEAYMAFTPVIMSECTQLIVSEIVISGNYRNLALGTMAVVNCTVPRVPAAALQWVASNGTVISSTNTLSLVSVDSALNGQQFICSASLPGQISTFSKNITVTVQYASVTAVQVNGPSQYVVDGDQNVELQCTVTLSHHIGPDYSVLSITWKDSSNMTHTCNNLGPPTGTQNIFTCSLQISTITPSSAGVYVCSAQVVTSSVLMTNNVTIRVEGLFQSANLQTPENSVLGQSSVLTCEVHTSLPVTTSLLSVQWMHRGNLVTASSSGFVLKQGSGAGASAYVTELTLSDTTIEHSGLYSCHVFLDTDRQQITAEKSLIPAFSHVDVRTEVPNGFLTQPLLGGSTRLSCSVTLHPQITSSVLTIQYQWSSNGNPRASGQQLTLDNLQTQDAVEFVCTVMISVTQPHQVKPATESSSYNLTIKITPPTMMFSSSTNTHYVGQNLNATCASTVAGVTFAWSIASVSTDQLLFMPSNVVSSAEVSVAVFDPISFYFTEAANIVCQVASPNPNLLQSEVKKEFFISAPSVSIHVISDREVVTDINGYNSFNVQCSGSISPVHNTPNNNLLFTLTKNGEPVITSLTTTPAQYHQQSLQLSGSSSTQQAASSGPDTLIYNCAVVLRISGSDVITNSNTTQVIVKGPSNPRAAVLGHLVINSTTAVTVQWSVPEVTYSPELYTVYYTLNTSGCPASDESYIKSSTVYGLNHTGYITERHQQYSVVLNNLQPIRSYCYKVVSRNTAGRTDSVIGIFITLLQSAPSGPPQSFVVMSATARTITLSWSPPLPKQQNGIITSYGLSCSAGGSSTTHTAIVSTTSHTFSGLEPFTSYTCSVHASTVVGDGPAAIKTVVTDEDIPETAPENFGSASVSSSSIALNWNPPAKPNGVIIQYQVQCSGGGQVFPSTVAGSQTTTTLIGLAPYTSYTCIIVARTSVGGGPGATISVTTAQDVPSGTPQEFSILLPRGNPSLALSWSPPPIPKRNGIIISYLVTCTTGGSIINSTRTSTTSITITELQPFTSYTCSVQASTTVGDGPGVERTVVTRGERPETSPTNFTKVAVTSTSITLTWSAPLQPNGVITGYRTKCSVEDDSHADELPDSAMSHTVIGLRPFTLYTCEVAALNVEGEGPPAVLSVLTKQDVPSGPPQGLTVSVNSRSFTLSWSPPLSSQRNGIIISYIVICRLGNSIINTTRTSSTSLTITELQPFTVYHCTLSASTIAGDGIPTEQSIKTGEESPSDEPTGFIVNSIFSRSVVFSWSQPDKPNGVITEYQLHCSATGRGVVSHTITGLQTTATVAGFQPFTTYTCNITAHTSAGGGPAATISVTTAEDTPGEVSDLKTIRIQNSNTSLTVTWKMPVFPNGVITGYELNVSTPKFKVFDITGIPSTTMRYTVQDLFPFVPYYFAASARTRVGRGDPSTVLDFVQEGAPERGPSMINATRITLTQIVVHWRPLGLEHARGFITSYTVRAEPMDSRLRQVVSVNVGPNERRAVLDSLNPKQVYVIIVSASTIAGESSENERRVVGFGSGTTSTTHITGGVHPTESLSGTIGAIAGGTVGLIVLAGLICMACIVYHCYKHKERQEQTEQTTCSAVAIEIGNLKPQYLIKEETDFQSLTTDGSFAGSMLGPHNLQNWRSQPIIMEAFPDYVTRMHQDSDNGFDAEFQVLGNIPQRPYSVAKLPPNSLKNRVHNIFPFDHSRVELALIEGEENSDYINASWINGYNKEKAYIATQGPLHHTVGDFWRMIWQHQLSTIIMLTKLTERGRPTCHTYWPTEEGQIISVGSGLSVYLSEESIMNGYKKRTLLLTNSNDSESKPLPVTHFQFTAWSNHGTPTDKMTLLRFIQIVRKDHPPDSLPLVVHCSTGVGRTATFILLDTMLQKIRAEGTVNIYEFVSQLRTRRNLMMQSRSHYIYVHDALAEYITCEDTTFTPSTAHDTISELRRVEREKTGFHRQFELLKKLTDNQADLSCSDATTSNNSQLNRYSYNRPYNYNRVRLRSGASSIMGGYINASWIDTEWQDKAFIAAQAPLKHSVDDFWTMIWETKSRVIVLLCTLVENNREVCEKFWPSVVGQSWAFGNLIVQLVSKQKEMTYTASRMEVSYTGSLRHAQNSVESLEVTLFHCKLWPENPVTITTTPMLSLVEAVYRTHNEVNNTTVTVACNDGLGRTGAFICIYYQLERLKFEETADVFQFVKDCRLQRKGLVQYLDQYVFIYNVLEAFVDKVERNSRHSSDV